ncbi:MAG: acyltransferase [Bacteroidales bacterium]|nr:acyltransferase [Bacteroidales bacterium]
MKDLNGVLFKYLDLGQLKFNKCSCSILTRIICFLRGINIGNKVSFIGLPLFRRAPQSVISIGKNCGFRSSITSNLIGINRRCMISTILPGASIIIGEGCGFSGTVIGAFKSIKIGNHVRCGANTLITDSDWHLADMRSGKIKEILIEDNVWIGEGVKIMKGVTIGKNSVIGAGSIVTKSIPENVIAAGNPCKVIKHL